MSFYSLYTCAKSVYLILFNLGVVGIAPITIEKERVEVAEEPRNVEKWCAGDAI